MSQKLTLISADGNKQGALGVIENANLRIQATIVPINIYVMESKEETFLIGGNWYKKYKADLLLSQMKLKYEVDGKSYEIKITDNDRLPYRIAGKANDPGQIRINTLETSYPWEEVSNDEDTRVNKDLITGNKVYWTTTEDRNAYLIEKSEEERESPLSMKQYLWPEEKHKPELNITKDIDDLIERLQETREYYQQRITEENIKVGNEQEWDETRDAILNIYLDQIEEEYNPATFLS